MISVVMRTSEEYNDEIKELFEKIKPLLDQGHSYIASVNIIKGTKNKAYSNRGWYKDLVKYGGTQGYPYKNHNSNKNKYGLLNVKLQKKSTSLTGYVWIYEYNTNDGIRRFVSSNDLIILRGKVEDRGLEWRVTNLKLANDSYAFNKNLQKNKRIKKVKTKTGVKHLHRRTYNRKGKKFFWQYFFNENRESISSKYLLDLKEKVEDRGLEWIVLDKDKYEQALLDDKL